MATTSLKALLEEIGEVLGLIESRTATGGSTMSLVDTFYQSSRLPSTYLDNCWVRPTSGSDSGQERRVATFAPASGTITPDRAWTTGPSNGTTYQVLRYFDWIDWKAALNRGLERCHYVDEEAVTIVANTRQYTMPTWVERATDLVGLTVRHGTTVNDYDRVVLGDWEIYEDAGALYINAPQLSTADTLLVKGWRRYAVLSADTDTTACPKELAIAAGKIEAVQKIMNACAPQERRFWERAYEQASRDFTWISRIYTRRVPRDITVGQPSEWVDPARTTWKDMT